ncbi:MAG TPA: carboxypeptidase-like regulatory domain-containing protein [Prolixibacteraceae bacterium]|jgi:hypothetical protein
MVIKFVKIVAIFSLFLFGFQTGAHCQLYFAEDMINVKGQLIDAVTKEGVGYAQVLNMRVRGGTMADALGNFSIQADPSDTLTFKSLSYKDKKVPVREIIASGNEVTKIALSPIRILLGEVGVEGAAPKVNMNGIPVGKSVNVPVELRSDYFASKPTTLTAIFRPISFLSYHLSKSEKEKRATLAAIRSERDWQFLSLVYNKDVIQRISGLSGEGLDNFMLYCNAFNGLPPNANSYDVEKRIRELMIEYVEKKPTGK